MIGCWQFYVCDFISMIPLMKDWKVAKRCVFPQIINTQNNTKLLKYSPHRKLLDMSVAYYIELHSEDKDIIGSFTVPDVIFKFWNITEGQLYEQAMNNMNMSKAPVFKDLFSIIKERFSEIDVKGFRPKYPDYNPDVYVLTNKCKNNGASYMLANDVLEAASCILKGDLYICPSSVHEVLICKKDGSMPPERLAEMVREVNDSVVKPRDILSYRVYEFSDHQLKIAA